MVNLVDRFVSELKKINVSAISGCRCEKCFQGAIWSELGNFITKPSYRSRSGFFGYHPRKSDLVFSTGEEHLLVECKMLAGNNGCDVRNALLQLLEYMISGDQEESSLATYNQGCVLYFDKCNCDDDQLSQNDKWLVEKMPTQSPNRRKIVISLVRLYVKDGKCCSEHWSNSNTSVDMDRESLDEQGEIEEEGRGVFQQEPSANPKP